MGSVGCFGQKENIKRQSLGNVRDLMVLGEKHIQDTDNDIFVVFVSENSLEAAVCHQVNITV